ncbi:HAMP domain protein [Sulfitobacter guttiformis KCTC 32187]|nr:HAMP domain protein [Sulfitobacter guttiformis KCTC 32187]
MRAAQPANQTATREVWPDGIFFFSSLVPQVGYQDLPSFGWRLIGRLNANQFTDGLVWLRGAWFIGLFVMFAAIATITAVFVLTFIRPFEELGRSAEQIAAGEEIYPPDLRRTREMAQLSAALARIEAVRES